MISCEKQHKRKLENWRAVCKVKVEKTQCRANQKECKSWDIR